MNYIQMSLKRQFFLWKENTWPLEFTYIIQQLLTTINFQLYTKQAYVTQYRIGKYFTEQCLNDMKDFTGKFLKVYNISTKLL